MESCDAQTVIPAEQSGPGPAGRNPKKLSSRAHCVQTRILHADVARCPAASPSGAGGNYPVRGRSAISGDFLHMGRPPQRRTTRRPAQGVSCKTRASAHEKSVHETPKRAIRVRTATERSKHDEHAPAQSPHTRGGQSRARETSRRDRHAPTRPPHTGDQPARGRRADARRRA